MILHFQSDLDWRLENSYINYIGSDTDQICQSVCHVWRLITMPWTKLIKFTFNWKTILNKQQPKIGRMIFLFVSAEKICKNERKIMSSHNWLKLYSIWNILYINKYHMSHANPHIQIKWWETWNNKLENLSKIHTHTRALYHYTKQFKTNNLIF